MDADYPFPLAKQIGDHLSERKKLAEMIYVGIAYDGPPNYKLNQTRDYTPTLVPVGGYGPEFQKYSGGSSRFYLFIKNELIPFVKARFQITSATLVGHSFGGLFALWATVQKDIPFDGIISVSPSLWYDHGYLPTWIKMNRQQISFSHPIQISMWIGALYPLWKTIPKVSATFTVLNDEDHDSVFPSALSKGLRLLYGL